MRGDHAALIGRESQEHPIILARDFREILGAHDVMGRSPPQETSDNRVTEVLVGEPLHREFRLANKRSLKPRGDHSS